MDAWEEVCGVRFVQVGDGPDVDLRIGAGPTPSARAAGFYRTTETDAYGNRVEGVLVFNSNIGDPPRIGYDGAYDLALHEVGHALGLGHSNLPNQVMSGNSPGFTPYWNGVFGRDPLQPDDIAGARTLWGSPAAPAVFKRGGPGPDTLTGGSGDDTLYGEAGNDALLGGAGDDSIDGGAGADRLWGQAGNDRLDGGGGPDVVFGEAGNDTIAGGAGGDIVLAGEGDDVVRGGDGDDRVWAEGGRDRVSGGEGADFLAGGEGDDSLSGDGGADYLAGEAGRDTLNGGAGYDVLAGGPGNDRLYGGREGDTFFGQEGIDTFVVQSGTSWIMDFEPGTDRLDVAGLPTSEAVQAAATEAGFHLHISVPGGPDLYLAWTSFGELSGHELV